MLRRILTTTLLSLSLLPFSVSVRAEGENACTCQQQGESFRFANGRLLSVCGYWDSMPGTQPYYSDFHLRSCTDGKILQSWDADEACRVSFGADTLTVSRLLWLPAGESGKYEYVPFTDTRYFSKGSSFDRKQALAKGLPLYTPDQMKQVLLLYTRATREEVYGMQEAGFVLIDKLLISAWSGSGEAMEAINGGFEKRFGKADGRYAESLKEAQEILIQYAQFSPIKTLPPLLPKDAFKPLKTSISSAAKTGKKASVSKKYAGKKKYTSSRSKKGKAAVSRKKKSSGKYASSKSKKGKSSKGKRRR